MKKLLSVFLILVISLGSFGLSAASVVLKVGDYIGDVLYSDITAYINGYPIPVSVINGKTLVAAEDLSNYNFNVKWNGADRTLKIEPNTFKDITPLPVEKNTGRVGTVKGKYVYTDIRTYISGEIIESYAVNGKTLINFESLSRYGKIAWDGKNRRILLIDLNEYSAEVLRLTNIERRNAGLSDLSTGSALTKVGFIRAQELISLNSHYRPNGRDCFSAFDENGVSYLIAGENIATGQWTPKEVVEDWMNSPGHRKNILNPDFGRLGVGVAMDSKGELYWSQDFTD